MSNTIIYLTDNSLREDLAKLCSHVLVREAGDLPIVSVSQVAIDLGRNVCVGQIGRSWLSLYTQLLAGLAVVETEHVVIAEHDCLYTHEALAHAPAPGVFEYNSNHWLVEGPGTSHPELFGMYSYWPRRTALSQLACETRLLKESTEEVMRLLDMGLQVQRGMHWYGEPGAKSEQFRRAYVEASSGRSTQLQAYLKDYVTKYESRFWKSSAPTLDIRWGDRGRLGNFTGGKRGKLRRWTLEPWGRFADVMESTCG